MTDDNADTPFISWKKGSVNIIEDDHISITVSSTRSVLVFRNLQSSDAGTYTCSKEEFPLNSSVSATINVETGPGMSLKYNIE